MNNNYGLVYPSQDEFYNVDVTNNNFSKLADSIDMVKAGTSKSAVIVSAHNSVNPLRANADYICGTGDCLSVFTKALEKVNEGGEILFLDGDYYLKERFYINKSVTLRGMGGSHTRINKHTDSTDSVLFNLSKNIKVQDIGFYSHECATDSHGIYVGCNEAVIDSCRFKMTQVLRADVYTNIYLSNLGGHIRISNCVFDKYNDERYNIYADGRWDGVIYANYCINSSSGRIMDVRVNLHTPESYDEISFGIQKSKIYVNGVLKG